MPYQTDWYIEDRVVKIDVTGELTLDQIDAFDADYHYKTENGMPPVHMLLNCNRVTRFPMDIGKIYPVLSKRKHTRAGWILLISGNSACQYVVQNLTNLLKIRFHSCSSVEEAFVFLTQVDETLSA